MTRSEELFSEAVKYIPGGVNSPVRGSVPRFIKKGDMASIWDEDDREYIDYIGSWGPMILGHNHPAVLNAVIEYAKQGLSYGAATKIEVEMAKLVCAMVPSIEMVRMVNSVPQGAIRAETRSLNLQDAIMDILTGCW